MHANRLMPNVYRKKLLAFTIIPAKDINAELENIGAGEFRDLRRDMKRRE